MAVDLNQQININQGKENGKLIIMRSDGHFDCKTFLSGGSHKCYVLDVDATFFLGEEGKEEFMKVYLWKGSYLYEDE